MNQKVIILGSTGSIGTQSLAVIEQWKDRFSALGLSTYQRIDEMLIQAEAFGAKHLGVMQEGSVETLRSRVDGKVEIHQGIQGLSRMATLPEADVVVVATVGAIGLEPTYAAIQAGKQVALANKEVLVMAGELMMEAVHHQGATLLPIDSEHSAIQQCLSGGEKKEVRRIIVTASGGPFRNRSSSEMHSITVDEALAHPTWNMGPKITIDSSTLMNKGLEVIEAFHLFGVPLEKIEVVVHPQSIVHSMVEFVDGSILAQLSNTDMKLPIQYALSYPERLPTPTEFLNLAELGRLDFEEPDYARFPCLGLAFEACRAGGTLPAVLSVANEVAVEAFLKEKIGYMDIPREIEKAMLEHKNIMKPELETILEVEKETRSQFRQRLL